MYSSAHANQRNYIDGEPYFMAYNILKIFVEVNPRQRINLSSRNALSSTREESFKQKRIKSEEKLSVPENF